LIYHLLVTCPLWHLSRSPIAEEDGKWGVNMLSSEQPQAYEDLFTLTPAEIENGDSSSHSASVARLTIKTLCAVVRVRVRVLAKQCLASIGGG
jgi:hypothetical protein